MYTCNVSTEYTSEKGDWLVYSLDWYPYLYAIMIVAWIICRHFNNKLPTSLIITVISEIYMLHTYMCIFWLRNSAYKMTMYHATLFIFHTCRPINSYAADGYFGQYKMMQKSWKMIETLANGYSSERTQRGLSNQYQHDRVKMVFKNICILVLCRKVASAFEGLISKHAATREDP